jgi:uncharacterized DUF497 family protein
LHISYDPFKNERNIEERGLSFDQAADLNWDTVLIWQDTRHDYPEVRYSAIGFLNNRLHVLIFIETVQGIRVISFRRANSREAKLYDQAH